MEFVGTLTSSRYYRSIFGICGNSYKIRDITDQSLNLWEL
ncbi:hypothetical protein LEP1GSC072_1948 [Leptospira noguchii str. Bonito]|nr:hypothetical protein LEP1GSC072_1948 [Leptospira noguchii str. Bonito]